MDGFLEQEKLLQRFLQGQLEKFVYEPYVRYQHCAKVKLPELCFSLVDTCLSTMFGGKKSRLLQLLSKGLATLVIIRYMWSDKTNMAKQKNINAFIIGKSR